ncbi:LacI family DNA-binding transcriptional regulator [Raineyella sp. LH-20]|uniref:LacI family DNA-binding transcriptional regulator n=1 Tax=Raineyella sp. LH-20 TaxID=3081204 RepID=UPI002954C1E7|nr:LacI family DNA-binding transcriptional regulator [Raineyella sp. LH-20]WOP17722.1 LacI family DNA-binding transcriptional regulator [Raineyella sp. LH-20]
MPAEGGRAPSMRDVARVAGVSHQTVSRVINDSPQIRPETRERVQAAIAELGYRPSAVARALAHGRTRRIGMIIESTSHYGPISMLRGSEVAARKAGYSSTTYTVTPDSIEDFREGVDFLTGQDVEGLVVIVPRTETLESLGQLDLPDSCVLLGSLAGRADDPARDLGLPRVGVDQAKGARLAVQHLLDQGHRVIGHVTGPRDWLDSCAREAEWRFVLEQAGLPTPTPARGDWSPDAGYAAADQLLEIPDLTAVFAANDQMALGLIHALSDRGLRIPEDISVVGFDDIPESPHFRPPLTTIHQDFETLGVAGVTVLLALLGEDVPAMPRRIDPTLVIRESTRAV